MNCEICNSEYRFSWTDTHGIAQCVTCGTPYRIYHYDEANNRVEKPPELMLKPEYVPVIKAYWEKHHRRMPSEFSFPDGQELASKEDSDAFYDWLETQPVPTATAPETT